VDESTPTIQAVLILTFQALVLVPALAFALSHALRARVVVGPVLACERPYRALRGVLLAGPQIVVLLLIWITGAVPVVLATALLLMGLALVLLVPGLQDATCGATGLRRGLQVRAYEELEEWRLVGEHLRFRLLGEWTSVPCPPAVQERVRERLLEVCPERESPFR